jgi:hypothetical protein
MFAHPGIKPLWPVLLFLPALAMGVAYLFAAALHQRWRLASIRIPSASRAFRPRWRVRAGVVLVGVVLLAAGYVALADSGSGTRSACEAQPTSEAKLAADTFYERGDYQHAGECYVVAGDQLRAQRAFVKAVGPNSEVAARALTEQGNSAKALANKVREAFHANH